MSDRRLYHISELDHDGQDVFLTIFGKEIVGRLRYTRSGRKRLQQRIDRKQLADIEKQDAVTCWRPIHEGQWPFPLPDPILQSKDVDWRSEPRVRPNNEFLEECDGWPNPSIRPSRPGEKPRSVEDVEVRLLRAFRTRDIQERDVPRTETLWPKPYADAAKIIEKFLVSSRPKERYDAHHPFFREEDYSDFWIDRLVVGARPVRFVPTPRDVSDYEGGVLKWLNCVNSGDRWLFRARSKIPALSWSQIADEERCYEHEIKARYRLALERILKVHGK